MTTTYKFRSNDGRTISVDASNERSARYKAMLELHGPNKPCKQPYYKVYSHPTAPRSVERSDKTRQWITIESDRGNGLTLI